MKEKDLTRTIEMITKMCELASIDTVKFLEIKLIELKNEIKNLFTPNELWFKEGKSLERYWKYLEDITNHEWNYEDVDFWFNKLRKPNEIREEISSELRYRVLRRDESKCQKCGRSAPEVELEVDHILPWSLGGSTNFNNLQTLCKECNIGKSNKYFK